MALSELLQLLFLCEIIIFSLCFAARGSRWAPVSEEEGDVQESGAQEEEEVEDMMDQNVQNVTNNQKATDDFCFWAKSDFKLSEDKIVIIETQNDYKRGAIRLKWDT